VGELKAEGVHYRYGEGSEILHDVNLVVRHGELVAVLGENGSGKTTLLKLLAALLKPSDGKIAIDDSPVDQVRDRVGIVFQNPEHQMIAASVEEELALGMEFRGVPPEEMSRRVETEIKRFELESLRFESPESMSGGQKQRVALAAIMITNPEFVLFDEPDSLLDAPSRKDLAEAVSALRSSTGIVWTCPHPRRLPAADRYYELREGKLLPFTRPS
jgi:energy-coupling factor transport system ATP-binding protein